MRRGENGCRVCGGDRGGRSGGDRGEPFFVATGVPVVCNVLSPSAAAARAAPVADVALTVCSRCGMIDNRAFDPARIDYSAGYENAQHFSPRFRRHAESTARRLVERHALRGRAVVEIGCGDGYFLSLLCRMGGNRGVGLDPSMRGAIPPPDPGVQMTIVPEPFAASHLGEPVALVACRHVLEHLHDPGELLRTVRAAIGDRSTVLYVEVPNALWMLRELALWDVIYEHCSYFTPSALIELLRGSGFEPTDVMECYGGQFLAIEARASTPARARAPAAGRQAAHGDGDGDVAFAMERQHLARLTRDFARASREAASAWQARVAAWRDRGDRCAVWGAGSKGVTFLNRVDPGGTIIDCAVDVNPRKQGLYVPCSGQRVIAPDDLRADPPAAVIVMNLLYADEIRGMLRDSGVAADLVCA